MDDVVRQSLLFRSLDDETAAALRASMSLVELRPGARIFNEGDPGDSMYLLVEGQAKLVRSGNGSRDNLLAVLGPGQMFGELSLFDLGLRDASAAALTSVSLLVLSHEQLNHWLEERPAVTQGLLMSLAGRLRRANDVVADLVFADVPTRVAKTLVDLANRFSVPGADPDLEEGAVTVSHGLTQTDIAQLVGAARETVNKALANFSARGWIRLENRSLVILDRAALENLAR